jgi:hypothetical protein
LVKYKNLRGTTFGSNGSRSIALQEPFFLPFYFFTFLPFHAMHEVTPSAVAMADRILIAV